MDKRKIMLLGILNPGHKYPMGDTELNVTTEEKDLGVLIENKLHFDKHIKGIVNNANRILGMIRIGFTCLDKDLSVVLGVSRSNLICLADRHYLLFLGDLLICKIVLSDALIFRSIYRSAS